MTAQQLQTRQDAAQKKSELLLTVCGLVVTGSPGSPTFEPLSQNLHFNKIPRCSVCTLKVERRALKEINQWVRRKQTLSLSQNSQAFVGKQNYFQVLWQIIRANSK